MQAAQIEEQEDAESTQILDLEGEDFDNLEEEFDAEKGRRSLSSIFESDDEVVEVDAAVQDESLLVSLRYVVLRGRVLATFGQCAHLTCLSDASDWDAHLMTDFRDVALVQIDNCGLSDISISALEKRGIKSLFPIQKHVFDPAMSGRDLIGRAKTGSGKTLAFSLPVIEKILKVAFPLESLSCLPCCLVFH